MSMFSRATGVAIAVALGATALTGLSAPVLAADMPEYPPIIEMPEPLPLPSAGGWYLRGDIGYKIYAEPKGYYPFTGYENMTGEDIDDTGLIGIGVGYKVNDHLRLDTTIDYEFAARASGTLPCPGVCTPTTEEADISAITGLVNGYVDIGTWHGITPYVGAGLGVSYLMTSKATSTSPGTYRGDQTWNFAWALMAGASYDLTERLALDVNYRYMNLGDAKVDVPAGSPGNEDLYWNDITAHEVRVGLRYSLN